MSKVQENHINNMKTKVTIIDQPCGSGKTSRLLKSFQRDLKYLVVVPLLSEVQRVIKDASVEFKEPLDEQGLKSESLEELLLLGLNVVTTHKLYTDVGYMAHKGLLSDYHLIIDEVLEVCRVVSDKSATSVKEFYLGPDYIRVGKDGKVVVTPKWDEQKDEINDTLDPKIYNYAKAGCLYLLNNVFFIRALPIALLSSGLSVTIMTYKAEGSMLLLYLKKLGITSIHKVCLDEEAAFVRKARDLITVKPIPSLKTMKFNYGQQQNYKKSQSCTSKVATVLKNLKGRDLKNIPCNEIAVTCVKDLWYQGVNTDIKGSKPGAFAVNSRMFKDTHWIANTTRGTNDYSQCSTLIYLYDQHPHPHLVNWLDAGGVNFSDKYALTELIQWIWRSRVRNDQPITIYMPRPRMRKILEDWLSSWSSEGLRSCE